MLTLSFLYIDAGHVTENALYIRSLVNKQHLKMALIDGPLTMQPRFQSNMPSNRRFIQRRAYED